MYQFIMYHYAKIVHNDTLFLGRFERINTNENNLEWEFEYVKQSSSFLCNLNPGQHLPVQSQQWKHQKLLTSFWYLY